MHLDDRIALARRLFGKGRGEPGPLRPEWVRSTLGVTAQTLMDWRNDGIPPGRVDDVLAAVRDLVPETTKGAAPSMTRRLLAGVIALERRANISPDELASAQESAVQIEAALEQDARLAAELEASRRKSFGRAAGQGGGQSGGTLGSKRRTP